MRMKIDLAFFCYLAIYIKRCTIYGLGHLGVMVLSNRIFRALGMSVRLGR